MEACMWVSCGNRLSLARLELPSGANCVYRENSHLCISPFTPPPILNRGRRTTTKDEKEYDERDAKSGNSATPELLQLLPPIISQLRQSK